jgi:hypothetical protein
MKQRKCESKRNRRRGITSVQVVLILPFLILFTIAVVQYGMWLVTKQTIAASSAEAVRTAARGGDLKEIERTVAKVLGTNKMRVSNHGDVAIIVERHGKPPEVAGNPRVKCRPHGPDVQPGEVRLTVCVRRGRFAGRRIPNWLGAIGRGFTPRKLQCSSLAAVE